MKRLFPLILLTSLFLSCEKENAEGPNGAPDPAPVVQSAQTYGVMVEEDIEYAQGLSHQSLNSEASTVLSLKLDAYLPNNNEENRPVFMFIHGGGFKGGSKQGGNIGALATHFTSRGWVFFSIDYRLMDDKGTVPQAWADHTDALPSELVAQSLAMYPAHRDAKAALRWIVANAATYKINTDYITVGGGSAGAITAITLGISELEDFRDEIDQSQDPTLSSTTLDQSYQIHTIVDFWGSKVALDALQAVYGHQRFDRNDPPLFIAHGTQDPTVDFSNAEELKAIYEVYDLPLAYYPLEGEGHSAWNATVDGKRLEELAFSFIVEQQGLTVE